MFGILAFFAASYFSYSHLSNVMQSVNSVLTTKSTSQQVDVQSQTSRTGSAATKVSAVTQSSKVIAPGPLRVTTQSSAKNPTPLSMQGVIQYTNEARAQNGGLAALTENKTLDLDAQIKLQDMFTKQYFEHVSPSGTGPGDLADRVGYAYVLVGENLALGDFSSDQDLVTAWMNSPGHRANILNTHYQEIGVAVGKGMYQGRNTWLAVQSFGMPRSACPVIDNQLKERIDADNITITNLRLQLDAKKAQIDATAQNDPNYNTYVNEFNALIPSYNALVESTRTNVATYNAGVRAYNECISAASAHTTAL